MGDGSGVGIVMLIVGLVAYFLPALVANHRGRDGQGLIAVLNFLLGWTVLGWVVLLIVAFTGESAATRKQREEQLSLLRTMADKQSPRGL